MWVKHPNNQNTQQNQLLRSRRDLVPLEAGKHFDLFRTCGVTREEITWQNTPLANTPTPRACRHTPSIHHTLME
jgi:hypothetical protein